MNALVALLLGVAYVAPPGPVNVETTRRGVVNGFSAAVCLQIGALAGDLFYATLALLGVSALLPHALLQLVLMPLGVALLMYLGYASLCDGMMGLRASQERRPATVPVAVHASSPHPALCRSLLAGVCISVANPVAVAFWLSMGNAMLQQAHHNATVFLASFFSGVLVWAIALPALIWMSRAVLAGPLFHYVSVACGLALVACGVVLGASTLPLGGTFHVLA